MATYTNANKEREEEHFREDTLKIEERLIHQPLREKREKERELEREEMAN